MRIFLTGATGFVGHHVAKRLAAEGRRPPPARPQIQQSRQSRRHRGRNRRRRSAPSRDSKAPSPAATPSSTSPPTTASGFPTPPACTAPTSTARANCCAWPAKPGVPRVVYTSCVATMHFRTDGIVINEDTPVSLADMVGHYKRSKFLAEQEAIAAAQDGQQVIILNPTTPHRPQRRQAHAHRPHLRRLPQRQIPRLHGHRPQSRRRRRSRPHPRRSRSPRASPAAATSSAEKTSPSSRFSTRCRPSPASPRPRSKIPFAVAATYAFFEEWITGRIRGKEPRATLEEVRMGRKKMYASSARAQQELGFRIVPVYPAMRAAIDWFRANGYAPAGCSA